MLSIDSAHPQKVDGMHRNRWTAYSGFGGRLAPESVVAIDRITHDYIFLTQEGYTFQPDSDSELPDTENLQVIGFSSGTTADEAYNDLLSAYPYLKETTFNEIYCYRLSKEYEKTRKDYNLKA